MYKFINFRMAQFRIRPYIYYMIFSLSFILIQTSLSGLPQHFCIQLVEGVVHVTADVDVHSLAVNVPLVSPSGDIYSSRLQVTLTPSTLQLVLDPFTCNGGSSCLDTDAVAQGNTGGELFLEDVWYLARVPQVTPYARSRLRTTESFVGCLGVSY